MAKKIKLIIDYDGTLTKEEEQVKQLLKRHLTTLSKEILKTSKNKLLKEYLYFKKRILKNPEKYGWEVNGRITAYSNEGPFILNTTIIQEMIRENKDYLNRVIKKFGKRTRLGSVTECSNYLFYKNSIKLKPKFRESTKEILIKLIKDPVIEPIILTNSKVSKPRKELKALGIKGRIKIISVNQYIINPDWKIKTQILKIDKKFKVDLRRPIYYQVLREMLRDNKDVIVISDGFSLAGSIPFVLNIPFILLKTVYTPIWSENFVRGYGKGYVIKDLKLLPKKIKEILKFKDNHYKTGL